MKNDNRGFIALISTLIIAAILLLIMTESGTASFFARFDSLGNDNKQQARAFAYSCVQVALLALASSSSYAPSDQVVDIGTDERGDQESCVIQSIAREGENITINAYASFDNSFANIVVQSIVHN